jgi:TPP-dependent indolepyruvate ferredoxin oxidoreductase alpha subunit
MAISKGVLRGVAGTYLVVAVEDNSDGSSNRDPDGKAIARAAEVLSAHTEGEWE